jgi:hypothetical protein
MDEDIQAGDGCLVCRAVLQRRPYVRALAEGLFAVQANERCPMLLVNSLLLLGAV